MDAPKDNPLMPHAGMTVRETSPRALAALCLALAVITFAVFGQTLRHQFVNFDDDVYVYEKSVRHPGSDASRAALGLHP